MKYNRYFCALLAMILTLTLGGAMATANAETVEGVYTHPEVNYSFTVPEGWIVIDGQSADFILGLAESNLELGEQLKAVVEQAKGMPIVYLYPQDMATGTFTSNININTVDLGGEVSVDLLVSMGFESQITTQYQSMFADYTLTEPMEVKSFGEWKGANIGGEYSMNEMALAMQQIFVVHGTNLYTFTLTAPADAIAELTPVMAEMVTGFVAP